MAGVGSASSGARQTMRDWASLSGISHSLVSPPHHIPGHIAVFAGSSLPANLHANVVSHWMELALEKLQRAAAVVPAEDHTPELRALLGFATCMEDAERQLKAAAQSRPGTQESEAGIFKASKSLKNYRMLSALLSRLPAGFQQACRRRFGVGQQSIYLQDKEGISLALL